jgi:hypothetical protein
MLAISIDDKTLNGAEVFPARLLVGNTFSSQNHLEEPTWE